MDLLRQQDAVVEKEGGVWFPSSTLGEAKDNVLIPANGAPTSCAPDVASHDDADLSLLRHPAELALVREMLLLPELVESIAENHEPHHLPHYALELATAFHDFYEKCRVLDDENRALSQAGLRLIAAAKVVL